MREEKVKPANRKAYITILSVIASFAVVALHANSFWNFRESRSWIVANAIESLMYFAVPVFFMITGATLLNYRKRYTTKQFFVRRVKRTVIPFLVWSLLGAVVYFAYGGDWMGVRGFLSNILDCKFINIYWFFPALFAVYLAVPFVSLIPEASRKQAFGYAIVVGFVMNSVIPLLSDLTGIRYYSSEFFFVAAAKYLFYVLLGYYIANYDIPLKWRRVIYICGAVGLLVHFVGTWIVSFQTHEISMLYKGYLNVPCILYSAAIFLGFRNLKNERWLGIMSKITKPFGNLTYGIYLLQWFVLQQIHHWGVFDVNSVWFTVVATFAVYGICAGIAYIMSKILVLREII